jgi:hypothetical protein
MVDDRRTEEDPEAPAEGIYDRTFRRVGPGGVMDHTAMMGTLDTTDTGGTYGHSALEHLAPIFKVARAHDLAVAARAVDPEDDGVPVDQVQVSQGLTVVQGDPEADRRRVTDAAHKAQRRLNEDEDFDPRFTPHFDRQAEAERAWVASMADMRPTVIRDSVPVPLGPSPEQAAASEQTPETVQEPTQTPEPVQEPEPASDPEDEPKKSFGALWEDASAKVESQLQGKSEEGKTEPGTSESPSPLKTPKIKPPNKADSKAMWVEWALACDPNLDPVKAESMTRLDLISEYDKYRPTENK